MNVDAMKVAFLSYGFGKEALGIGKYAWYLVDELRKIGIDVDVFTTNIRIKSFGAPLFYFGNIFLKLQNYDLVHSNEGAGVFLHHPRMVETYHHDYKQSYDINSLAFHKLETSQCHKVKRIVVPSFLTKKRLIHYGFEESKISVILHGVDSDVFIRNNNSRVTLRKKLGISNYFVVINVGQLIRRKRQSDIIRAMRGISNTALVVVGKGEEESNLKKLASEFGINLIHFSFVPESFLVDLYNAADAYVHTAIIEGFGLSVLEAMSCGLPIIAYETADFSEIVGNAGFILKQGDIRQLRESIDLLRQDEKLGRSLGNEALRLGRKFTWRESALKHAQVYKEVLEKNCS
jgi:glycosyltransferase involved in cell wall biosynthesis